MLVTDPHTRKKMREEKINKTLNFLQQETYTNIKTIQRILQLNGRRGADRLLTQMVALGFLIKHEYSLPVGKLPLWGITMDGLSEVYTSSRTARLL